MREEKNILINKQMCFTINAPIISKKFNKYWIIEFKSHENSIEGVVSWLQGKQINCTMKFTYKNLTQYANMEPFGFGKIRNPRIMSKTLLDTDHGI